MNTTFNFKTDSLGRRVGLVKNFSRLDDGALLSLKSTYMLSMSLDELTTCRDICAKHGSKEMSISALYLLDELVSEAKKDQKNIAISSFNTDSKDIFETYEDLIKRYSAIQRKTKTMLPLSDAFEVASEYMALTGKPSSKLPRLSDISLADGEKIYPISSESCKNSAFFSDTVFALITPTRAMSEEEYVALTESFISYEALAENIRFVRKIALGGIMRAISEAGCGVSISPTSLPDMPPIIEPSHLVSEHHGRFLIGLSEAQLDFANILCESSALSLSAFASATPQSKIFIRREDNSPIALDLELVRTLSTVSCAARACAEEKPVGERSPATELLTVCETTSQKVVSLLATELKDAPFGNAIETSLSAILPQIVLGIPRSDIALKLKYSFSENFDGASLGADISAVLGIYRVMSELYLQGESSVEYSSEREPYISVAAIADTPAEKIPTAFCHEHSGVYLLSFARTEDGMPNFESFRGMCDFYQKLLNSDCVRSAVAVCGNVGEALASMSSAFECSIKECAEDICKENLLGIILETNAPLEFGVFLGTTKTKEESI